MRRKERPLRRAALAIVFSLGANAVVLWVLAVLGAFQLGRGRVEETRVALAPLSSSQWEANRAVLSPARPEAAPPPPPAQGKLVELSPEQKAADRPPPDARFLSDRNTRVDKQTVSRWAGVYPRVAPRPEPPAQGKAGGSSGQSAAGAAGREGAPGDRLALAKPGGELQVPEPGERGDGGRRARGLGTDALRVSPEALARIAGGPSMDGTHEGLEEGDATWLQSREFRYATYMNQMRREIGQQWYPRVRDAQRERDPDGSVFFYKERTVTLALTLDTDGNVRDLSLMESSTVPFFDEVAKASVRAAQPFPNPPRGMFEHGLQVRIPFSFTMYPGDRHGALFWRAPSE